MNNFPKDGAELITHTSEKEAEEGDAEQSVDDAKYASPFGAGRDVPESWQVAGSGRQLRRFEQE